MDFSSFFTSLGTSFVIFVVLMLLFTWLSRKPGNNVVYYTNRILKGLNPYEAGSRTRNPFAWIRESISSLEKDIIAISGIDTAVHLVFLTTGVSLYFWPSFNRTIVEYQSCFWWFFFLKGLFIYFYTRYNF